MHHHHTSHDCSDKFVESDQKLTSRCDVPQQGHQAVMQIVN